MIYWNLIKSEEGDYLGEDQIEIIVTNENVNIDTETAEHWTDIDLTDKPLDTKINVRKDLKSNNPIHEKFVLEAKQKNEEELCLQKQRHDNKVLMTESVAKIKAQFSAPLIDLLQSVRDIEKQVIGAHNEVKQAKKLLKKNEIQVKAFEQLDEKEKELKQSLGKMRKRFSCMKIKSQNELRKLLKDCRFYYTIENFTLEKSQKEFIFCVYPYSIAFYLDE